MHNLKIFVNNSRILQNPCYQFKQKITYSTNAVGISNATLRVFIHFYTFFL